MPPEADALNAVMHSTLFRALVEHSPTAIAIFDPQGHYIQQNPAHRTLMGYPDEELFGQTLELVLGRAAVEGVTVPLESSGFFRGEIVCQAKGGHRVQIDLTLFSVADSEDTNCCYVSIQRDVESGGLPQEELERSVSLLKTTLESTADGILALDRAQRVVSHNRRLVEMWSIPQEYLDSNQDAAVLEHMVDQVKHPMEVRDSVRRFNKSPMLRGFDRILFKDGRVVERYTGPQLLGKEVVGRVWSFRDVTDEVGAEEDLRESEARFRSLFNESRHAIYITSLNGDVIDANPAAVTLFGYEREEMADLNARRLYADPADRRGFRTAMEKEGSVVDYEVRLRRRDGSEIDCLLTATATRNRNGEVVGYQGIVDDITERKLAQQALESSEQYFRALIENALDMIIVLSDVGTVRFHSPSIERVLGKPEAPLEGQSIFEFVQVRDRAMAREQFAGLQSSPGSQATLEVHVRKSDGDLRTLEVVAQNLLHDSAVAGVVVNARDVTERRKAEAQILHNAFHDRLTGLPNRALLMDRMTLLLRRAHRSGDPGFSLLFIDLDRFKLINDSLGHVIGDKLLIALARRLEECVRPGDTVARLGGDEVTVLIDSTGDTREAVGLAERIEAALREPFVLDGHEVFVAASIGIASSRTGYTSADEVLRDADIAMYGAKAQVSTTHRVFDEDMHLQAVERLTVETDLRKAVRGNELQLHYQPIVDLRTQELVAFEALVRWQHPTRGLLLPGEFLDVAEDTGLIVPIGWWVLEEACTQIADWRTRFGDQCKPVQVNLSGRQFSQRFLVKRVKSLLHSLDIPGTSLVFELTEGSMMEDAESTVVTLEALRDLGIKVSIDDFGTGYSSLSYLHRFPTARVKIDRSFIARLTGESDSGIVQTILDLARDLNMEVVAEGVETASQLDQLRDLNCTLGQGFLFSKALPAAAAEEFLATGGLVAPMTPETAVGKP